VVIPEWNIAEGDLVVMTCCYFASTRATGLPVNPQVVHAGTLKDGKVTTFQQHADTLGLAIATGRVALYTDIRRRDPDGNKLFAIYRSR
ncbi:MAG: hypothetical protein M3R16_11745, partial [Pseudomonadota bacterium]|nr:hypothetical protein [Pseudomonadota bacterium]